MAEYELRYNGEELAPSFTNIEPGVLAANLTEDAVSGARLEVFQTTLADMVNLEDATQEQKGQTVSLGDVASHVDSGRSVAVQAEPGYVYDVFYTVPDDYSSVRIAGGGRYAVTGDPEYDVKRTTLTFQEAQWLGARALGVSDIESEPPITARVEPMTAWGDTLSRLLIAGFALHGLKEPGVMVNHLGGIEFYHGLNAEETRLAAGIDAEG